MDGGRQQLETVCNGGLTLGALSLLGKDHGYGDLDICTFVYDANGVRWACDLGSNSYSKAEPAYWESGPDGRRWQFYRKLAEGHNTLVVGPDGGPDQDPLADCSVRSLRGDDGAVYAVADLSDVYDGADVLWFMHTAAEVAVDGPSATLRRDGKRMGAAIRSPDDAAFEVMEAAPLPTSPTREEEEPVEGVRKLAVSLPEAGTTAIEVRVGPDATPGESGRPLGE